MNRLNAHLYLPLATALSEGREQILLTPHNAAYYLPLIQALADGKRIQINHGTDTEPVWDDPQGTALFTCPPHRYRIAD